MSTHYQNATEQEQQNAEAAAIVEWLQPESLTVIQTRAEGEQIEAMSAAAIAYYLLKDGIMKASQVLRAFLFS